MGSEMCIRDSLFYTVSVSAQETFPSSESLTSTSATSHTILTTTIISTITSGTASGSLTTIRPSSSTRNQNAIPTFSDLAPQLSAADPSTTTPPNPTASGSSESSAPSSPATRQQQDDGGLVNYYFVFLGLLICVLLTVVWLIYRQKKRKAYRSRHSRQNALQRDLNESFPFDADRWMDRRRWLHGGRWRDSLRRDGDDEAGRQEGLNEEGEAPPPYKSQGQAERDAAQGSDSMELQRPGLAVSRQDIGLKPPDYEEQYIGSSQEGRGAGRHPSGSSLRR